MWESASSQTVFFSYLASIEPLKLPVSFRMAGLFGITHVTVSPIRAFTSLAYHSHSALDRLYSASDWLKLFSTGG